MDQDVGQTSVRFLLLTAYDGNALPFANHPERDGQPATTGRPISSTPHRRFYWQRSGEPITLVLFVSFPSFYYSSISSSSTG